MRLHVNFYPKIFFSILVLTIFVTTSCEKNKYETINPGSYYPAYPGSYWNYINSNGQVHSVTVEDEYKLHTYSTSHTSDNESEPKYVPEVKPGGYLYGYIYKRGLGIYSGTGFTILKEELNEETHYNYGPPSAGGVILRRTEVVDTTVVVNGISYYPTIQVKEYDQPSSPINPDFLSKIYYYTENVGLIKEVHCWGACNDSTNIGDVITLVDYNINL